MHRVLCEGVPALSRSSASGSLERPLCDDRRGPKSIRTSRGLTQDELEALSGIPRRGISRYENNHVEPSLHSLSVLAKGLGVSAAHLVRMADI